MKNKNKLHELEPERRVFFKTCASAVTLVCTNPMALASQRAVKRYFEVLLVRPDGEPITSEAIQSDESYLFNYPFVSTPCFLINLGKPLTPGLTLSDVEETSYAWTGGVGPNQSVVAFSAICSHKMSYPTRTLSFINYRADEVHYRDENAKFQKGRQLIYCCSERSAYDPARGAEVLGGPASQPLTTIVLRHDKKNDHYYATGTLGGEMYDQFFEKFGFRLAMDTKNENIAEPVKVSSQVYRRDEFSARIVGC